MATTNRILIKSKSTAAGAPADGDLQIGELAVNTYTGLTYMGTKLSSSGSAGGAVGEVSTIAMPVSTSTSLGTSNLTTSTTGAIKSYVDTQVASGDTTLANTKIWIGDSNGDKAEFALSGDVTMTAGGAVTIANDAVESGMLNDNCISGFTNIGAAPANGDELLISDGGTLKAMTVANLAANSSFASGVPTTITVADESSDATCFPLFATAATGDLGPKSGSNLTFASNTGILTATGFAGDITGDVTGDVTGNADTATAWASGRTIALTGDVTYTSGSLDGSGNVTGAATIAADAVHASMVNDDLISGSASALTSGLVSTDELLISDAGTLKNMDVSVLQTYLQSNLTFTTNTDADVTNANLLTKLAALESSSGAADENITIGADSGDTIVITGNLQVSGTTTTVNSTTVNLNDHNVVLDSGNGTGAVVDGAGITLEGGSGDDATFTYSTTGPQFEMKLGSSYEDLQVAKLTATSLDISGSADIDGTMEADAYTVDGATLQVYIEDTVGAMLDGTETNIAVSYDATNNNLDFVVASDLDTSGNAATATLAATSTVVDAAEASTTYYPALVDGLTGAQALEAESGFTFVGNTGILSATGFSGSGASLTTLNGSNISSGTVAAARVATLNQDTTGTAAIATTVTVADESTDTSCNVLFTASATGNLAPKSGTNLTFNSSSGLLTATLLAGDLTGDVTGNADTSTKIASITNSDIVQLTATQTLTNKTIVGGTFA
jgi:hypothetical protein